MEMKTHKIRDTIFLFLTAMIWGAAFVAQSVSMDYIGPFTFICLRSVIGGLFLIPVIMVIDNIRKKRRSARVKKTKAVKAVSLKMRRRSGKCGSRYNEKQDTSD